MQIALLVPFVAIALWKSETGGYLLCLALIFANVAINMAYTIKYDLKMGFLHINNYYLLEAIIAKPWTKLQNLGFGCMAARLYWSIVKCRRLDTDLEK